MSNFFNTNYDFIQKPINPITTLLTTSLVFAPLDRVKILMQTARKSPYIRQQIGTNPKIFQTLKMVLKGEGFLALWKGCAIPIIVTQLSHQLTLGQISTNLNYAITEELYTKTRFGDDENIGLKSIYAAVTINSLALHPFNVIRTNHAIQVGSKSDKIKTMGLFRIVKEMIVRYGIKSLYKGFMSHYIPLMLTTTGLINYHNRNGVADDIVDTDIQELTYLVYLSYFLLYPLDTFCRNKMIFTKISKIHIYESQHGARSFLKFEKSQNKFNTPEFKKSIKKDAQQVKKNAKEYQSSHAFSQAGQSYIPKTNHNYKTVNQIKKLFRGRRVKKLLQMHLTQDEILRRSKTLKQYGHTGGFFRWVKNRGIRFMYRGSTVFGLSSVLVYFSSKELSKFEVLNWESMKGWINAMDF